MGTRAARDQLSLIKEADVPTASVKEKENYSIRKGERKTADKPRR